MLRDNTERIFISEWSQETRKQETISPDNVLKFLHGGWLFKSVKHQDTQSFINEADMFLRCNRLPIFINELLNVKILTYDTNPERIEKKCNGMLDIRYQ